MLFSSIIIMLSIYITFIHWIRTGMSFLIILFRSEIFSWSWSTPFMLAKWFWWILSFILTIWNTILGILRAFGLITTRWFWPWNRIFPTASSWTFILNIIIFRRFRFTVREWFFPVSTSFPWSSIFLSIWWRASWVWFFITILFLTSRMRFTSRSSSPSS